MNPSLEAFVRKIIGFGVVGVLSTLTSTLILYITLEYYVWPVYSTYTLVYIASIFLSYKLNSRYVFKKNFSWVHLAAYFLTYLTGMFIGLIIIAVTKQHLIFSDFIFTCLAVPVTLTWNFLLANVIFEKLRVSLRNNL
jgi:putative flippase GtrA